MITAILFDLILTAAAFGCASLFRIKSEESLPLICSSIVMILFLCGIFGFLPVGVTLAGIAAAALAVCGIVRMCRRRTFRQVCGSTLTPPFFLFILLTLISAHIYQGILAIHWDEFSHWIDAVKAMSIVDALGTDPAAGIRFQSYPPGMALFQYFGVKLDMILHPGADFPEWLCYHCYQLFSLAFFMPFTRELFSRDGNWAPDRKFFQGLLKMAVLTIFYLFVPQMFFDTAYVACYIDCFVSVLAGIGFARILTERQKDLSYRLGILSVCMMLVLAKDIGLLYAIFIAAAFMLDMLFFCRPEQGAAKREWLRLALTASVPLTGSMLCKLIWSVELRITNAALQFHNQIDYLYYIRIFFAGGDQTYRQQVADKYKDALLNETHKSLGLTYAVILAVMTAVTVLLLVLLRIRLREIAARSVLTAGLSLLCTVLYIFMLGAVYMYNFSEYEALELASMERYLSIAFLVHIFVLASMTIMLWNTVHHPLRWSVVALSVLVCPLNFNDQFTLLIHGQYIDITHTKRQPYDRITSDIQKYCSAEDKVLFISQGNKGYDYWAVHFIARPVRIMADPTWDIGNEAPYNPDPITPEAWGELVRGYTYLAIYKTDELFMEQYSPVFSNPEIVHADCLYSIDPDSMTLTLLSDPDYLE